MWRLEWLLKTEALQGDRRALRNPSRTSARFSSSPPLHLFAGFWVGVLVYASKQGTHSLRNVTMHLADPSQRGAASQGASIEALLGLYATQCFDLGGQLQEARAMLPTWARLWNEFAAYMELRSLIMRSDPKGQFRVSELTSFELADHLVKVGLLHLGDKCYRVAGHRAAQQLRGSWLEEMGAVIACDAGCEEVRFSQRLVWQTRYSKDPYLNEIDVLARREGELIFVSCKALAPLACQNANGADRIFDALKEVAYWRQHFNGGRGQAILLTTADLIDERHNKYRNAGLMEHADVLGVKLVSADAGDFNGLVRAFKQAITAPISEHGDR